MANVFVVVNTKRIIIIHSFIRLFSFNNYITCSGKFNKALQLLGHLNPLGFLNISHLDKSTKTTTASFSVPYHSCFNFLVLFLQPNFIVAIKQLKGTVVPSKMIRAFVIGITKTCFFQGFHQPLYVFLDQSCGTKPRIACDVLTIFWNGRDIHLFISRFRGACFLVLVRNEEIYCEV